MGRPQVQGRYRLLTVVPYYEKDDLGFPVGPAKGRTDKATPKSSPAPAPKGKPRAPNVVEDIGNIKANQARRKAILDSL